MYHYQIFIYDNLYNDSVATTTKPNINENHFDIKIANIVHRAFWNDQYFFMSIDIESYLFHWKLDYRHLPQLLVPTAPLQIDFLPEDTSRQKTPVHSKLPRMVLVKDWNWLW